MNNSTCTSDATAHVTPTLVLRKGSHYYREEFLFITPQGQREVPFFVSADNPYPRMAACRKAKAWAKQHRFTLKARIWSTDEWRAYYQGTNTSFRPKRAGVQLPEEFPVTTPLKSYH